MAICATFTWLAPAPRNLGLAIVVLAFILSPDAWRWARRQPLAWICLATVAYIALRTGLAVIQLPETAHTQWEQGYRWATLFIWLPPVAWAASRGRSSLIWAAALSAAGLVGGTLFALGSALIDSGVVGRFGGYMGKAIAFAFYSGLVVLVLLTLLPRIYGWARTRATWIRVISIGAGAAAILLLSWGFFASDSRGPLLTVAVVYPIVAAYLLGPGLVSIARRRGKLSAAVLIAVVAVAALAGAVAVKHSGLQARVERASTEIGTVLRDGLDQAPLNNVTWRLHMWRFGLRRWAQHPLLGLGPGSVTYEIRQTSDPSLRHPGGEPWDHLHSAYVMTLFTFGLVGFGLFGAVGFVLYRQAARAYRDGRLPREIYALVAANLGMILVYSLTDFRQLNHDWRAYWILAAGAELGRRGWHLGTRPTIRARCEHRSDRRGRRHGAVSCLVVPLGRRSPHKQRRPGDACRKHAAPGRRVGCDEPIEPRVANASRHPALRPVPAPWPSCAHG